MPSTITLPLPLRLRLIALRWRIRMLRAVRGFALLVVLLGIGIAAAMLVDYRLDLPDLTRQIVVLTLLAVGAAWLLRSVVVPLCRRIDTAALAAVIEEKFPDLGERLSSAVELAGASAEGHGSPLLISLLLEETARQSECLDFRAAAPARRAVLLAAVAVVILLLITAPALVWPQQYGEQAQRIFQPWNVPPPPEPPPAVEETPPVEPVAPIELAADSPTITITPPAYARSVKEEETFHGLIDLAPLQYSDIRFDFRFTRPVAAAYLEFSREPEASATALASGSRLNDHLARHPLTLSADRQAASLTIPAIIDGKYRLVLEAEHNARTEMPGGTIRVQPDQPPSVPRFTGKEDLPNVLRYERIPFEIEAADDIAVAGIELEYRINDGESVRQPLELEGGNTPSAVSRSVLDLAGKVKKDDRFSYRFRVSDNLPKEYKGPHVIIFPPERWMTLRISQHGPTLQQQQILAQRDEIDRKLQAIRESIQQEMRNVEKVKQEAREQGPLPFDQLDSIQQSQRENRANQKALSEAAQLAEATPELKPVADMARDVADQEMQKTQEALEQTPREEAPAEQTRQLKTAEEELNSAVKRLKELKDMNDRLAQERLDRAKLETLAQRENHLAEQAAELAAKHPELDPKMREQAEKMEREQAEAAEELEKLAQQYEPLKQALQNAREAEEQKLAERLRELAQEQRELAEAEAETKRKSAADRRERPAVSDNPVEDLVREQAEVAKQAEELARNIEREQGEKATVSQQAQQVRQEAEQAAHHMRAGALPKARDEGQRSAEQLRQLAAQLTRTPRRGDWKDFDPLMQARQLGQRQIAINRRLRTLADDTRVQAAQQQAQQRHLQQEADEASQKFQRLAQQERNTASIQAALQKAHENSKQAERAMQQARDRGQSGESETEQQSQEQAAQLLEQAARAASEAAQQAAAKADSMKGVAPEVGKSMAKAQQQMADAQGQLKRGQAGQAQAAMRQAAQSLTQAAQQMPALTQRPNRQGQSNGLGSQAGGLPDLSAYGLDQKDYASKSWGELPGELRTKIVQDVKARYGDDYARMIKSYFEQIADTKKK